MQQLTLLVRAQTEGTQPVSASDSASASAATLVLASPLPPTDPNLVRGDALVANPERYAREPETCTGFLLQSSLVFEQQPSRFPTERSKVAYIISLLTSRALAWATSLWELDSLDTASGESFTTPAGVGTQRPTSCPSPKGPRDLNQTGCLPPGPSAAPLQLGHHLAGIYSSPCNWRMRVCRVMALGLMLSRPDALATSVGWWEMPGSAPAFIDSGAAESFLDVMLAAELGLLFEPLECPLLVRAIDGCSLGPSPLRAGAIWEAQRQEPDPGGGPRCMCLQPCGNECGSGDMPRRLRDTQGTSVTAPRSPPPAARPYVSMISCLPGFCDRSASFQGKHSHPDPHGPLPQGMQVCGTAQASICQGDSAWSGYMGCLTIWCLIGDPSSLATFHGSLSSGFHPESNGQTEWVNQDLARTLRCLTSTNPSSWAEHLPWAEYAHNTLRHSSLGMSPFECQFGFPPPMFPEKEHEVRVPAAEQFIQCCQKAWQKNRASLLTTTEARKQVAD
ncbi:hypothetical protein AOLI_G00022750 [Acnodon oligacanthus]